VGRGLVVKSANPSARTTNQSNAINENKRHGGVVKVFVFKVSHFYGESAEPTKETDHGFHVARSRQGKVIRTTA
jgi:hypothetical protein